MKDLSILQVLEDVLKAFTLLDGYYELENVGREKPITKLEFLGL